MKNCATYTSSGAIIENCQKINFFYGPNGSGKSTIGNFLRDPNNSQYRDCEIERQSKFPLSAAPKAERLTFWEQKGGTNLRPTLLGHIRIFVARAPIPCIQLVH